MSQEILLRPAKALDVDMLDHHLQHVDSTRPNTFTPSTEEERVEGWENPPC